MLRTLRLQHITRRGAFARLSTVSAQNSQIPWYADPSVARPQASEPKNVLVSPSQPARQAVEPPSDAPAYLRTLFTQLQTSPFLDTTYLRLTQPVEIPLGVPLPFSRPKGRRKRGGSDHGPGVGAEPLGQIWSWLLLLQVKEGTERRGAVEHVAKVARNMILKSNPDIPIPPKGSAKSRTTEDGWAMLDFGDHAVHVLSKSARQKWFGRYYRDLHPEEPIDENAPRTLKRFGF